jgi:diguanylate cyclase (GGDEF)-like protein
VSGKRRDPLRIGVLSSLLGGGYAGPILAGAVAAAGERGVQVVGIQTLDLSVGDIDTEPPRYDLRAAWRRVAGFIVLVDAVSPGYLEALRAPGRPVVLVSGEDPGLGLPVVRADNRRGMREAVSHLVEHGHRRVAFCGWPAQPDIRERRDAYRRALRAHGIAPDDSLVFEASSNLEAGGEAAALAMLAAGLPCTAVVAATDLNAVGLIRALSAAGLSLPRDQAVIGFDGMGVAPSLRPTLSSVHQSFEATGRLAAGLLLRMVGGGRVSATRPRLVPTWFVPRESCGCTTQSALQVMGERDPDLFAAPRQRLGERLERLLTGSEPPGPARAAGLKRAVDLLVGEGGIGAPQEAGRSASPPTPRMSALRDGAELLFSLSPRWTTIRAVVDCLREYRQESGPSSPGLTERDVTDVAVELSRALAERETATGAALRAALSEQFQLSMALLSGTTEDPRSLRWLSHTGVRAACLGLWSFQPASGSHKAHLLRIAGAYARRPARLPSLPAEVPIEDFPPAGLLDDLVWEPGEVMVLVPLKTRGMELGMLAMLAPAESTDLAGRDRHFENHALLSAAIEREVMVEWLHAQTEDLARAYKRERDLVAEVRRSEERLRHTAHHDPLTGLPNRALFLDRLSQALARTARNPELRVGLLFLDLDGFKQVNDGRGHAAGDRLLVQVGERLSQRLRRADTAARLGGDEFAVLLEEVAGADALRAVAAELRDRLSAPYDVEGAEMTVTAAVGWAITRSGQEGPDDLLREADAAMYREKAARRARLPEERVLADVGAGV